MLRDGRTYAGLISSPPQPAATHAELNGNTLIIEFNVDRHFPSVRPSQLRKLTWGLDISLGRVGAVGSLHDQLPNNPHPEAATLPPGIRQSDGRIVKPS